MKKSIRKSSQRKSQRKSYRKSPRKSQQKSLRKSQQKSLRKSSKKVSKKISSSLPPPKRNNGTGVSPRKIIKVKSLSDLKKLRYHIPIQKDGWEKNMVFKLK
jgi:hypothetical protein